MKTFSKKLIATFVLICMLLTIATPVNISAAEIALNKTNLSVRVKQTYQLKVTGTTKKVTWSSSDSKIATVTSEGKVKGIKTGTATIKAKVSGKTYSAKVKVVSALSAKDFIVSLKDYPKEGITRKIDFISVFKNESSYSFWGPASAVFTANRGIKNGSSASEVEKVFGAVTYKSYNSSEVINNYMKDKGVDDSQWKQYMEYKFTTQGDEYRLRFYLNNSKKVNRIVFVKNYNSFNAVASMVKLKFASEETNGGLRTEIIDGKTVAIIPYGDSFSLVNEVPKTALEFVIKFYDEEGKHIGGRDPHNMLQFGKNYKFDELEYWYLLDNPNYCDFKDLTPSEYKYFSIDIWNADGMTKDAPQGGVTYYFRIE